MQSGCIDGPIEVKTWIVNPNGGTDFTDIQSAIDSAGVGDIIKVTAGTYITSINISTSVTLTTDGSVKIGGDNSTEGLVVLFADDVVFSGFIIENASKGVVVFGKKCVIASNIIRSNEVGLELTQTSADNIIYNNFFHNEVNIIGSGTAELNVSKRSGTNIIVGPNQGGNYWDDYGGYDMDGDGIGDTELPYRGGLEWLNEGDWFPLTNRTQQPEIFVDDDFTSTTDGWNTSHFSSIGNALEAVGEGGVVYVSTGVYKEYLVLNKTVMILGENQENTIIETFSGLGYGTPIITILQPNCYVANFTITTSYDMRLRSCIDCESQNTTIKDVTIKDFNYGIRFLFVHGGNNVISTSIYNCTYGIYCSYSTNNVLRNNFIQNSSLYSIFLNAGSDENIIDNNILRENEYAMRVKGASLNLIVNNSVEDNIKGLYFCCGARNNTVTRNSFTGNIDWHASDQYRNIWDKEGIGNYWDDYQGNDLNDDGIGDEVYTITEGYSVDRYPVIDLSILN